MLSKLVITAALLAAGSAAFAHDLSNIARTVPLQDGTSVYFFQDGKMAMEDKFGRSVSMSEGQAMVTRDGQQIRMAGNETARLACIRRMVTGGA
ncbi:MAG: CopK family periplasmic copper-binding protein [Ramlibacter sp.]